MSRAYSDIAFTPAVRAVQTRMGSRQGYEPLDHTDDRRHRLGAAEAAFIEARDGFYQASVGETGWPYVQFRGGPAGFLKVLDSGTIGYADFRGNVQYISVGNLEGNNRVSIILMDYANRRRLKILGRARIVDESDDPALLGRLELAHYRARVERAIVIDVEGVRLELPATHHTTIYRGGVRGDRRPFTHRDRAVEAARQAADVAVRQTLPGAPVSCRCVSPACAS